MLAKSISSQVPIDSQVREQEPMLPSEQRDGVLNLAEMLLKDRDTLYRMIQEKEAVSTLLPGLLLLTLAGTMPTGLVLGSYTGGWQLLYAAIKVPLLLLMTLVICHSAFWAWGLYFRSRLQAGQVAALTLSALATTSLLLLGLCPLLWLAIGGGVSKYHHAILAVVGVFAVAGLGGVWVLSQGLHVLTANHKPKEQSGLWLMKVTWVGLYGLVGMQVAWMLRPYLFHPWAHSKTLPFLRDIDDHVYSAILRTILSALGLM